MRTKIQIGAEAVEVRIDEETVITYSASVMVGDKSFSVYDCESVEEAEQELKAEIYAAFPQMKAEEEQAALEPAPLWMKRAESVSLALERWINGEAYPAPRIALAGSR